MFKKILVPIDGSSYSQKALDLAANIAQKWDAELEVLYVDILSATYAAAAMMVPTVYEQGHREGDSPVITAAKEKLAGSNLKITYKDKNGDAATRILDVIETDNCDLVVMGSRGLTGLSELLLGSVSNKVVALSKVPVLIAK